MNTTTLSMPADRRHHPIVTLLNRAWHALADRRALTSDAFPDTLDAATLRDIGAPEWMVSRAHERAAQQALHLLDVRPWRGG